MTTSDDSPRTTPTDWLVYAISDLNVARGPRVKDARPAVYAFHAQQAVEKFLKAVLVAHDVEPPRTHDIRELSVLIDSHTPHELPEHLYYPAIELTKYEAEFSNPMELGDVPEEEADAAATIARDVGDWAFDTLGAH